MMLALLFVALAASVDASSAPRLAYLVLAHDSESIASCSELVSTIYDQENWYLVHVDIKYKLDDDRHELKRMVSLGPNVEWGQMFDVRWGRWSMIEPTLWAMVKLLSKPWDAFVNLSGDSWPVLSPASIRRWVGQTAPHNLVTSSPSCPTGLRPTARSEFGDGWHKKSAYPHPMVDNTDIETYYGSQWMVLRRSFVDFVIGELEREGTTASILRDFFIHGTVFVEGVGVVKPHIPDETFFPTLLNYYNFSLPEPIHAPTGIAASFYIRMDEHYPWSSNRQRYLSPELDKKERPWGPYYLGVYDLLDIKNSKAIFIRKTSRKIDQNIFDILPVANHDLIPPITWPKHSQLKISEANPHIETVRRGNQTDCVRVAESIHCPPNHQLRPDVAAAEERRCANENSR